MLAHATRDEDGLLLLLDEHAAERRLRQSVDVRLEVLESLCVGLLRGVTRVRMLCVSVPVALVLLGVRVCARARGYMYAPGGEGARAGGLGRRRGKVRGRPRTR